MRITNIHRLVVAIALAGSLGCAHQSGNGAEPATLRIFIARHGQTDWNLERRLQGQTDRALNEKGMEQARELAARVAGLGIERVYSSALQRSRETARIAAGGLPIESLATLNEQSIGRFEGLYIDGRDPAAEGEFNRRSEDATDTLDGGESSEQFYARVCGAVGSIRGINDEGTILIVGHGGTNSMILRCLLDLTAKQADEIKQANDELYLVELPSGRTPHLWKFIPKDKLGEL